MGEHVALTKVPVHWPNPPWAGNPSCAQGSLIPLGHVTDTLAGAGHALEAKPSCHPLVALQISNLTVNFLWQLLYPKGEEGPDLALDKVLHSRQPWTRSPYSALDSHPHQAMPLPSVSEWKEKLNNY